jgi:GT2 family glycosyltransferase
MGEARVSVVVVTFESRHAIGRSLPALLSELSPRDEVIVVDNASADGTAGAVADVAPVATLIRNESNTGFAAAANRGAEAATGDLVVLLNPDAIVQPGFREAILRPLADGRGWAAWQGLVTMERGTLVNTSGNVVHFTGISWAGGAGEPASATGIAPREVPFASGACLAVPRERWRAERGFSPDFFMYCEDADLSLRLRLAGGRIGVEPAARADHDYEFEKGPGKWRRLERNRWATLVRTYPGALLGLLVPALLATEAALVPISIAGGWFTQKLGSWWDLIRWLPRLRRERRAIQATRRVTPAAFAGGLTADLDSAYLGTAGRSRLLRALLRGYWSAVLALLPG